MADDRQNDRDDLEQRITDARGKRASKQAFDEGQAENTGWAVGVEFVGSALVGALIGFFLDEWLGTTPWLMIVLLVVGFAAGLRRAMSMSKQFDTDPSNNSR